MTIKHNSFLTNLLQTIVVEYGREEVLRTLMQLPHTANQTDLASQSKRDARSDQSPHREAAKPKRLTAIAQVTKATFLADDRDEILALAKKFDRKEFLPSVGDVREFLAMAGSAVDGMKDRTEGFRYVLPVLVKLPPERLRRLVSSNIHSGPAQLGPLADAIRSAGEARRRGDHKLTPDPTAIPGDGSPEEGAPSSKKSSDTAPAPSSTRARSDEISQLTVAPQIEQGTGAAETENEATLGKSAEADTRQT